MCLETSYWAEKLLTDINLPPLMPDEDNEFGGSLVSDFIEQKKWWLYVNTKEHVITLTCWATRPTYGGGERVWEWSCGCLGTCAKLYVRSVGCLWLLRQIQLSKGFSYRLNSLHALWSVTCILRNINAFQSICGVLIPFKRIWWSVKSAERELKSAEVLNLFKPRNSRLTGWLSITYLECW